MSFNFMAAVTICSDFGAHKNKQHKIIFKKSINKQTKEHNVNETKSFFVKKINKTEGMMLKLKLQYFVHLMQRVDSLEKTLMLGGIGGRRRRTTEDEMAGWHH